MGDPKGFLKIKRKESVYRSVCERIKDYAPVNTLCTDEQVEQQASRCMDCGTPFCHWACPLGNYIPEWNDLTFREHWEEAYKLLDASNNFPEITGRVCPAICEYSCVLGINDEAVTIRENELAIIEYAFKNGFIKPKPPKIRTGKTIAIIGSGPAGLTAAVQLNKAGHTIHIYEKNKKPGGILRYGIPDFKLEKTVIDRRTSLMEKEGIKFFTEVFVGKDYATNKLLKEYDAICLTGGSGVPRDLNIEGRNLGGIHFAMDYLTQQNRIISGEKISKTELINAKGKKVVVIGGGDTGSDCVGTANRQGAPCIVQIEVLPKPSLCRTDAYPWPNYPLLLKTSSSHKEGTKRHWSILTQRFIGQGELVKKLECVRVEFTKSAENTCPVMKELPDTKFEIEADLVILAVGFLHPEHKGLIKELGVKLDNKGNIATNSSFMTSIEKIFSAGDMHRGQSLVVSAIAEGRRAAHFIDKYLTGNSNLPCM